MASSQDEVPNQVVDRSELSQDQVPDEEPDQVPVKSHKSSPDKITKPKNPGRVAAGKRLAEMNKKNKAMKNAPSEVSSFETNWQNVLAVGGLAIGVIGLYFAYKENKRAEKAPREVWNSFLRCAQNLVYFFPLNIMSEKNILHNLEEAVMLTGMVAGVCWIGQKAMGESLSPNPSKSAISFVKTAANLTGCMMLRDWMKKNKY